MKLRKTESAFIFITLIIILATAILTNANSSGSNAVSIQNAPEQKEVENIQPVFDFVENSSEEENASASVSVPININTATKDELCTLNGIGQTLAQRIIDYRENNGKFPCAEDITAVKGIGDGIFSKIKDFICVE